MGIFDAKPVRKAETEASTEPKSLDDRLTDAIRTVYDPEIPVNIYEMGLIYKVEPDGNGAVQVDMTLTSPHCPAAQDLPIMVKNAVLEVEEIESANVDVVWDPPWTPEMMSDAARMELGMM